MLKPQGYATVVGPAPDGTEFMERDTVSCGHCSAIVTVKPGSASTVYLVPRLHTDPVTKSFQIEMQEEAGAFCRTCMRSVCLKCHADGRCIPLMKRIEQMEAKGRMLAGMGIR